MDKNKIVCGINVSIVYLGFLLSLWGRIPFFLKQLKMEYKTPKIFGKDEDGEYLGKK